MLSCLTCFPTNSTVMLKFSKVVPSHLLLKGGITVVFPLVNTLTKKLFNILAFCNPLVTISPFSSIRFPTDALVLVLDWT